MMITNNISINMRRDTFKRVLLINMLEADKLKRRQKKMLDYYKIELCC